MEGRSARPILVPVAVDRASAVPLWAQVLDDLRGRVEAGEFPDRFPTDQELVADYGVSRHTAREAVRRLQAGGVLTRQRGRGSFVRQTPIEQPLGALYSLHRSVAEQGYRSRSVVRCLRVEHDPSAAENLGLGADAPLVHVERLRLADDEPMALDESWLPASVARPLLDVDLSATGLYRALAERTGVRVTSGEERIRPALPTPAQRRLLELGRGQPVLALERTVRAGAQTVEWRRSVVRGDRWSFVAQWSETGPGEPSAPGSGG